MKKNYRIFTLSPGSTSTKLAVFEGETRVFKANVSHDPAVLAEFKEIKDQLPYRIATILEALNENGQSLETIDAFSAYSGGLEPMEGGIYSVDELILKDSREGRTVKHPALLGAQIIDAFAKERNVPAFLVNPPDVDEFQDLARVTGMKGLYRESRVHVLNQKEVAIRYATTLGKTYEDINVIVAHVGGGLSVAAHKKGKMIDGNDVLNGDGPMAPNRSGSLPAVGLIKMAFSGEFTEKELIGKVSKTGGLLGHLGTDNTLEIKKRIKEGDQYADLIYKAMAYQLSKFIGSYGAVLEGEVDGILLTGGVSNDPDFVANVAKRTSFIAPVVAYGGDFEMEALASGAIRALEGEEALKQYSGKPIWSGFGKMEEVQ